MANRHIVQAKAKGGGVAPKHDGNKLSYNAKGSNVLKEAKERKSGGRVPGFKSGGRLDKRARGGGVAKGKDMTSSPWSAAHMKPTTPGGAPAPHKGK